MVALVFPVSAADTSLRARSVYNGNQIDEHEIGPGLPPPVWQTNANVPDVSITSQQGISADVPALDWSYGCSATSAAMDFGYFDRTAYPNMYTGPTNGGVFPLTNAVWGTGENPLSASHKGIDGRTVKGHVDDYYSAYGSSIDPYYGSWTEHSPKDSLGDFMGTSQYYHWQNVDGGTTFFFATNGAPLSDYTGSESATPAKRDGTHGMKLFAESRGYSVTSDYNQYIYGYNGNTQGFTYTQYKAEIDAGYPVLIQLSGHTMLGVGYSGTNQIIVHDTWDYADHTMTWGGTYGGMQHFGVTVFHLAPSGTPSPASITVTAPNGGETWQRGTTQTVSWSYTGSPGSAVKIVLLKAGVEVGTIIASTSIGSSGTGSYSWPIASSGTTGSDFAVSVQSISQPTVKDTSNNYFNIIATPPATAITVTAPNGGETWQRGTTQTVSWSYTGSPGSAVKIVLLKAGVEVGTIIASTSIGSSGTGSYSWPIASSGTTGSDYKVSVQSISQPTVNDTSTSYFTINAAPPATAITVTAPNGGETWQRGTTKTISWSYTGSPGSTVKIVLLKAGVEVGTIIASTSIGSSGTGSYSWPIASSGTTGSDYKVSVQSISLPTVNDTSTSYFTINAAEATSPASITITAPNGGETWKRGTTQTIRWSYTGSPGSTVKIVLLKAGVEVGTIIASTSTGSSGTGSYSWPIASTGTTGSDYKVSVQSISLPTVKDTSNSNFNLTI